MKKVLVLMSSLLVLVLVACGSNNNGDDEYVYNNDNNGNGEETMEDPIDNNENNGEDTNVETPTEPVELSERGTLLSTLIPTDEELDDWAAISIADLSIVGVEASFDEVYGIVFLTPVNVDQAPWVTILAELEANDLTSWSEFIQDVESELRTPAMSMFTIVLVSPLNSDLFWLKFIHGSETAYSTFEVDRSVEGRDPADGTGDAPILIGEKMIYLNEWRQWFVGGVTEVTQPISLIMNNAVVSVEDLLYTFGPTMIITDTQGTALAQEFMIIIDFANENDTNITHITITRDITHLGPQE